MIYKEFKNKKQEEYYLRTKSFLETKNKILVNPGGMGLGKTWAIIKALKESPVKFSFITCPTAPSKNVWGNDFNKSTLKGSYAIWFSKASCCIKKKENKSFDINKECKDDCEYWKDLQKNGEYTLKAHDTLNKLDNALPTFPTKFYKKYNSNSCLMPICRLGLKTKKYIIGDYFGFLNKGMFDAVINSRGELNKNKASGVLIIDEAHLIPERAKDFLSKTLNFTQIIIKLKEEINCDYINRNLLLIYKWKQTIKKLEVIHDEIIRNKIKSEERFNYNNFYDYFNNIEIKDSFDIIEFENNLTLLAKEVYKIDSNDDYESSEEPYCSKFLRFISMWREKLDDPNYKHYFQYKNINKGKVRFIINCCDTSKYISDIFTQWDKIILASGTIPDREYFNYQTGIESFGNLTEYQEHIDSYSIKDNVFIYSKGNFNSTSRENTYKENSDCLNKIISNLNGRIIIYIQNKGDSSLLKSLLKTNKKIINFCSKDDGFFTSQEDWMELEKEFNQSKESIAIMNINGRVEGFNFEHEDTGESVENIIVFGYPWAKRGYYYDDQLLYYTSIINNKTIARRWIDYTPILIKIHQAACRSKRKEEDQPVILLWDVQFGTQAYNYMPDDLKGNIFTDIQKLMYYINKIKEKRNDNGINS